MNIDNSIGKALFHSGDPGGGAAAGLRGLPDTGLQGAVNRAAAGYAGSLFQQLIVQMLTAKGSAEAADGAGGGAQDPAGEAVELFAEMLTAGGNPSGIGLQDSGNGADETIGGQMHAGILSLAAESGNPDALTAVNGGQADGLQALMTAMAGVVPGAGNGWTASGSRGNTGAEATAVLTGTADGNGAAVPASLKALFAGAGKTAVPVETGTLQEGADARQAARRAVIGEITRLAFPASGSDGKTAAATDTGQTAASGGTSAAPAMTAPAGLDPAGTASPSPAEPNAKNQAVSGPESSMTGTGSGEKAADTVGKTLETTAAASKSDRAAGETAAADTGWTAQEYQQLNNTGQTVGAAEQNPSIPSAEKAEPYSQIRDEILAKLVQKGPAEFKMKLEPAELGQIDIKLKLSDGKLVIDILAASSRTQALLASQVDKLIAGMGLQNVQVESVQVGQQANSQSQDSSQGQGYQTGADMDFSQRRQQEQLPDEIFKDGNQTGAYGLQQREVRDSSPAGAIEAFRYGSYRMDYTV